VRERGPYIKAVVEAIHAQGVCAVEQFEEIAVKTSNDFNEQYNVWVSPTWTVEDPNFVFRIKGSSQPPRA
jgi:hypothetical protein